MNSDLKVNQTLFEGVQSADMKGFKCRDLRILIVKDERRFNLTVKR